MIARSAFAKLRYSVGLLAGTALGLLLTYLAPQVLAFWGPTENARWLGIAAWIFMSAAFLPTVLRYEQPAICGSPFVALFYPAAGFWKGRSQAKL